MHLSLLLPCPAPTTTLLVWGWQVPCSVQLVEGCQLTYLSRDIDVHEVLVESMHLIRIIDVSLYWLLS
jgi:hypothetical protein